MDSHLESRWLWLLSWQWDGAVDPAAVVIDVAPPGQLPVPDMGLAFLAKSIADRMGAVAAAAAAAAAASPPAAGSEARTCTAARVGNVLGFTATAATPAVPVVAAAPVPAQAERISGVYMSMLLTIGIRGGRLAYSEAVRRLTRVAVNKDAPMNLRDLCVAVCVCVGVGVGVGVWVYGGHD